MKKSVILLIAIVYIAAIMIVGFYGMKIKIYDEKVMVEDVVCDNLKDFNGVDCAKSDKQIYQDQYKQGINYYAILLLNDIPENGYVIIVNFSVIPQNATVKTVEFVIDRSHDGSQITTSSSDNQPSSTSKPSYTIVDNKNGTATITVYKSDTIRFSVRPADKASDVIKNVKIDILKV